MRSKGYVYIYTIGCQMNTYDSEKLYSIMEALGYEKTLKLDYADIVICNTCSIREKAQEKAFSFLGRMVALKKKKPHLVSIMAGCVAQQEGEAVFKRLPYLDIVLGTQAFDRLASLIALVKSGMGHLTDIETSTSIFESIPDGSVLDSQKISRFVTIMQGCDNYCTYCVVPYVRGRERSRKPERIIEELRVLADNGVREITLLGQNVNSYGKKEGICSFPSLLEKVNAIDGIERIRFATSHPKDLSDELIFAIRDLEKVCCQLHLPVQSGSNRILKKMNRGYTREVYLERISLLRQHCPEIALSSDMIVGFPSETRADFDQTLDLVTTIRFDGLFAFAYSDRPNAPAVKFSGKVSEDEKMARLNELLDLQENVTEEKNQALVGKITTVLVEGKSRKKRQGGGETTDSPSQMTGRTESGKIVHFRADNVQPGMILEIKIEHAYPHSLWGTVQGSLGL